MDDDPRGRMEAEHAKLPAEGKEELLQRPSREAHNRRQAAVFDRKVGEFARSDATLPQVVPSMRRIAEACRPADDSARVVDVGCGTGALVDFLKQEGVEEGRVIGVDLSAEMAGVFQERFPEAEAVHSDFVDFAQALEASKQSSSPKEPQGEDGGVDEAEPASIGTVIFNAMFGNVWDQRAVLESASMILEEGGKAVVSHPLGRDFVARLKALDDTVVPYELPDEDDLSELIKFLPLSVKSFESTRDLYLAVMTKTPHRACEVVQYLRGEVSRGYGRGSKKLGVPTANLPESLFAEKLRPLPTGVYFGWALLEESEDQAASRGAWKCVANVGYSPTFAGQENPEKIVEGHLIGYEGGDFYGKTMRMVLIGFQRRERKFGSFDELVSTIQKDVRDAATALEEPRFAAFKTDGFFKSAFERTSNGSGQESPPEPWSTRDFVSAMEAAGSG